MNAEGTIETYYEALRGGDPLYPFFADEEATVKFGVGERLTGYEAVRDGLRDQTRTTDGWVVESDRLIVTERDAHAWFSDNVFMAWNSLERDIRYEFETRWSGTLERRPDEPWDADGDAPTDWRFVGMHVSSEAQSGSSDPHEGTEARGQ